MVLDLRLHMMNGIRKRRIATLTATLRAGGDGNNADLIIPIAESPRILYTKTNLHVSRIFAILRDQ